MTKFNNEKNYVYIFDTNLNWEKRDMETLLVKAKEQGIKTRKNMLGNIVTTKLVVGSWSGQFDRYEHDSIVRSNRNTRRSNLFIRVGDMIVNSDVDIALKAQSRYGSKRQYVSANSSFEILTNDQLLNHKDVKSSTEEAFRRIFNSGRDEVKRGEAMKLYSKLRFTYNQKIEEIEKQERIEREKRHQEWLKQEEKRKAELEAKRLEKIRLAEEKAERKRIREEKREARLAMLKDKEERRRKAEELIAAAKENMSAEYRESLIFEHGETAGGFAGKRIKSREEDKNGAKDRDTRINDKGEVEIYSSYYKEWMSVEKFAGLEDLIEFKRDWYKITSKEGEKIYLDRMEKLGFESNNKQRNDVISKHRQKRKDEGLHIELAEKHGLMDQLHNIKITTKFVGRVKTKKKGK